MDRITPKWSKDADRALSERATRTRMLWPANRGTLIEGRNQAKRERRAVYHGQPWVNPRAAVQRPTKAVRPAANKRRRAMTAKARAKRAAL